MNDNNVSQFPGRGNGNGDWQKIVRDVKDQLNKGRKPANGGGGGGGGPILNEMGIWGAAIVIAVVLGAWTSFYTVDISEEAVVTRLGKYLKTSGPGAHIKAPFFIDKVVKVPKRILQLEFGFRSTEKVRGRGDYLKSAYTSESLMLTGDLNVADVEWIVKFRIKDAWKFLFHAKEVSRNIRDVSMSIVRRVVGDRRVGDVLTVGRVEIADEVKLLMQELLDRYDIGIQIEQVLLQDVNPPESVKPAFNEVNAAKQEQEQAINIAEREYNKIIPASRGKAEKLIADAEAYSVDKVNRAKGDASRFSSILKEYKLAPEITKRRMYLETIEKVFRKMDQMIVVDDEVRGLIPLFSGTQNITPTPSVN